MSTPRHLDPRLFVVLARDAAQRFDRDIAALSGRIGALSSITEKLRSDPTAASSPETLLQELEKRDAELALAHAELREISEAFAGSRERLESEVAKRVALFESNPDACLLTDSRGSIEEANAGAERLLAMAADRLAGKLLISFVARRDTRLFRDRLCETSASRSLPPFDLQVRPRGGHPVSTRITVREVLAWNGRPFGLSWTLRSATPLAPALGELRSRMAAAARSLRGSLVEAQAQARVLAQGLQDTAGHAETVRALARASDAQQKSLDLLEEIALTEGAPGPRGSDGEA